MTDTIFHKILRKEIPAEIVYEDEQCIAIRDIHPVSPTHVLFIPKETIPSVREAGAEHERLLGHLLLAAADYAGKEGLSADGYRLVLNCGENGGQTVDQLHLHLLGGRAFGWPPG
jgi:histidine triad (HIT) family protein